MRKYLGKTDKKMRKYLGKTDKLLYICHGKADKITYLPIYMLMFIKKEQKLPTKYSIDLSGLV